MIILVFVLSCTKNKQTDQNNLPPENNQESTSLTDEVTINKKNDTNLLTGIINDNNLRVRSEPDTSAEILGLLNQYDYVTIIDITENKTKVNNTENYWYKIITSEETTGWIFGEYVNLMQISKEIPSEFADMGKYDWFINNVWWLEDGRELVDPSADFIYWNKPPLVIFRKVEIPPESIMYQERLRKEKFTLVYQTEETDKLFILEDTIFKGVYNVSFGEQYSTLSLVMDGNPHGLQRRIGLQANRNYPLVGIWGSLPYLTEYRIVDPVDCFIYMKINEEIPNWAVRKGTYLLKQIDENTFETVSSFSDGRLRLKIRNDRNILLLPLFTLPDGEKGRVAPLSIRNR
jgi:uncharacterized protein YgiM (DUF1202 family)